jgi:hypothetical protein
MTNVELFGLLLALIGLAFAFETPRNMFLRFFRLKSRRPESPATFDGAVETRDVPPAPLPVLDAREIVRTINGAPPFQQAELSHQYNGIDVDWCGYLKDARPDWEDKDSVRVNLALTPKIYSGETIWFTRKISAMPEIRTLKQGSKIRVKGKIIGASGPGIYVTVEATEVEVLTIGPGLASE